MSDIQPVLTIDDAMAYFQVSKSTIKRLVKSGELKSYKVGGQRRIKMEWIIELENNGVVTKS